MKDIKNEYLEDPNIPAFYRNIRNNYIICILFFVIGIFEHG